jgi:hypothetical protein
VTIKRFAMMSPAEEAAAYRFLDTIWQTGEFVTKEQWWQTYPTWGKGGNRAWARIGMGGTMQMTALCWYQHLHKPGSKENRPRVIFRAVCRAAGIEPTF